MEETSMGSDGWSSEGGVVVTPKMGSAKDGLVRLETQGDAINGCSNWIGATLGAGAAGITTGPDLVIPW